MRYFLGADLGGTKTHMVIADETGRAVGFGEGGPANHQDVGFDGMLFAMRSALEQALTSAQLTRRDISGAGFGIAGYDWPSEKPAMLASIDLLELSTPLALVNDAIPGLVAGAEAGWGVNVVSGTGCNCRGWDEQHQCEGRVTGYGTLMGEAAGSSELVYRAMQLVGQAWTKRGPQTALSDTFIKYSGAKNLEDLIEGYTEEHYQIGAETAPLVFQAAYDGDTVARELITWAGSELGEMANSIIRQLNFEKLKFDIVLSGSMFDGGNFLIDPMRATIQNIAPNARLVRLNVPPVLGAVLIGMEQCELAYNPAIRSKLAETIYTIKNGNDNNGLKLDVKHA
jgi:N-acetylglucosamine kinase-like BadF-type ATPase